MTTTWNERQAQTLLRLARIERVTLADGDPSEAKYAAHAAREAIVAAVSKRLGRAVTLDDLDEIAKAYRIDLDRPAGLHHAPARSEAEAVRHAVADVEARAAQRRAENSRTSIEVPPNLRDDPTLPMHERERRGLERTAREVAANAPEPRALPVKVTPPARGASEAACVDATARALGLPRRASDATRALRRAILR